MFLLIKNSHGKTRSFSNGLMGESYSYYTVITHLNGNGMWKEVNRVRGVMENLGLRKNPGCNWIEVKNKVHTLLAGDRSHPNMAQIIEKLEGLGMEMKKSGYRPDTNFVLQDVEEQDKENILCGHSEN
ncbi:hypothetical protein IFM89_015121 [Coptis chinensis]|uniref:DYW domain-containing protein n=1 Tax=Coptis chinensis TaxID=261450 RepID=A0A835IN69_9MAGN|nr:hypothetical protein IFM89_015121 [Coptis chinensis]